MSELRKIGSSESDKSKARAAINKIAANGRDIELSGFINPEKDLPYQPDPSSLPDVPPIPDPDHDPPVAPVLLRWSAL